MNLTKIKRECVEEIHRRKFLIPGDRSVMLQVHHLRQGGVLKGKPRFVDFNLPPPNWGAHFTPWVTEMSSAYP
ncbi:hypothetical protein BVC80_1477g30 [Macleaya cordata]|uniref:Transport inhibitor response 1 domain-containing protein n=1 Tax=Macleaya cordata TaxID=56857 RepID=A0A200PZ31_MACCD|nr:hypothetical protein BVC80_1477g30 [Macleaya cordata]